MTTIGAGPGSSGTVNVVAGGDVDTKSLTVGTTASSGTVAVDGFFSSFGSPARWDVDGDLTIGSTGLGNGNLVVQRSGVFTVSGSTTVRGTAFDGQGTLTLQTGGNFSVVNALNITSGGTLNLTDTSSRLTVGDIDNSGVHLIGPAEHFILKEVACGSMTLPSPTWRSIP